MSGGIAAPADPIPLQLLDAATDLPPARVPAELGDFLRMLGVPTLVSLAGRDPSRTRVVTTLLHGNEPSGLHAVHAWLRAGTVPAVNVLFFVGAVRTALEPPGFAHRFLPGRIDLNRCWRGPMTGRTGTFAAEVLRRIRAARPESLIDIHNNTGHSPPYGVGPASGPEELALTALFADRFVRNDLHLGTLVEATRDDFPSVTVECGRAGDTVANANAAMGLERYLTIDEIGSSAVANRPVAVYTDPIRVEVRAGVGLAFGEAPVADADFTVDRDIDRHNFERLDPGTPIGWTRPDVERPVVALGPTREDLADRYFAVRDGVLETTQAMIPIMMTTNRRNALDDCLFYAVRREG